MFTLRHSLCAGVPARRQIDSFSISLLQQLLLLLLAEVLVSIRPHLRLNELKSSKEVNTTEREPIST